MHDVRRILERRPPQTTRVRRRPEPQLVHDRRPRVRPVNDFLVPMKTRVQNARVKPDFPGAEVKALWAR